MNASYWRKFYKPLPSSQQPEQLSVDVVIIGAGITGLTTAYLLAQAGKSVAVIDKDTVGGGTTGRTTGKVTSQHSLIYDYLQKRFGKNLARDYGRAHQSAIDRIEQIISSEQIDCDWQRRASYVFTTDPSRLDSFRREAEVAAEIGLPASFETQTELPFDITAAVRFSNQASFNAQMYLLGLAGVVQGKGGYIFEQTGVKSIRDGEPASLTTNHGTITAKDIVVATSVPTLPLFARVGYCLFEYPEESYLVAGTSSYSMNGMYISPDKHHYSILKAGSQLLIGGQGHLAGLRGNVGRRFERLEAYGKRHFDLNQVSHRWSDRDYIAYDQLPLIGKVYPWSKHLYLATAFKKWGLTGGTVAGMVLSDRTLETYNPWASIFTSPRLEAFLSIPRAILGR